MEKKNFRVWYTTTACQYYDIEAEDEAEACRLAEEMADRGDEPDGEGIPSDPEFSEVEEL